MFNLHDFLKALDDIKEALIAITSTVSVAAVCGRVIYEKFKRKK